MRAHRILTVSPAAPPLIALALLALVLGSFAPPAAADGLIVVRPPGPHPLPVPPGHYPFAPLEVRFHQVDVDVKGQIATTAVDQVFHNPTRHRLEGTYLFPLPEGAEIDRFSMEIDGEQVEAELLPAEKARRIYLDIVRSLRDPALLEYAGRGLFQVRIFPIEPGSDKRVKLRYTQLLEKDGELVSYRYPLNTEKFSAKPLERVAIRVEIDSPLPLKSIYSPSHEVEVRRRGDRHAVVGFEDDRVRPDTDFELFFSQRGADAIGLDVLSYREGGGEDGYFLLLASPGALGQDVRAIPRDLVFVLDTSGSMAGEKLRQAQRALTFCLANLNPGDRFEVVRFSTEAEPFFGRLEEATPERVREAEERIEGFRPVGGTAIEDALLAALAPGEDRSPGERERPYAVIFLTDGLPTIGTTDKDTILARVEERLRPHGARVFSFGIGTDVNTHLLDGLAERSRGLSQYVLPKEDIEVKVSAFYRKIRRPVMVDLELELGGTLRARQLYPRDLPDLFDGDQLVVLGRYRGDGDAAVTLTGRVNGRPHRLVNEARFARRSTEHAFIPRLWAVRRIGYLLDEIRLRGESAELRDEVAELARRYGVVTPYTSYLILEDEARRRIPASHRTQSGLERDPEARRLAEENYDVMLHVESGDDAVGSAQSNQHLQRAENSFAADMAEMVAGPLAAEPLLRAQQKPKLVANKAFYQNGAQWVDVDAQESATEGRVRVQFNSSRYFELVDSHPEAQEWLSVSSNLLLKLGETVYEIVE